MIQLDVISDPICPWCYIGKTNLETALREKGFNPFDIFWRPFQLNPDMPDGGMDRRAYLAAKFGAERAEKFYKQIEEHAKSVGLDLRFDRIETTPNTFDAHRLIRWSRSAAAQNEVVDRLFRLYFIDGADIGDRDLLLDVAEGVGMERAVVARLYEGDADRELVQNEEATAREIGVNGVPTFIVAGKHVVTGAQPPDLWARVLDELRASATEPAGAEGSA